MTESLFGMLANLPPESARGEARRRDQGAVRVGAALRLPHASRPGAPRDAEAALEVLDAKTRGAIRAGISNAPQTLAAARREGARVLVARRRAQAEARDAARARREGLRSRERAALPRELGDLSLQQRLLHVREGEGASTPRRCALHLLEQHGIGLISEGETDLRIAFSCLELAEIEPLFEALHRAIQELL